MDVPNMKPFAGIEGASGQHHQYTENHPRTSGRGTARDNAPHNCGDQSLQSPPKTQTVDNQGTVIKALQKKEIKQSIKNITIIIAVST